ncbi:apolipoprotein L3-like [Apodemus sylvaticus]|uniref:apolipoprotein L3-like n=1 Tax=Apodemus sylvaticus TaxID=10129 RepID=UPI002242D1F1|nr:apolipoprotein L3-like [Apodemus sylvaticus]XP_052017479.1 apolipoprotein L3-like [Apodemus sylvaticus]
MAHASDSQGEDHNVEDFIDFFTEVLSKTDLRRLITEDGTWKGFVEAAELSSEEEAALCSALKENLEQDPTDENDGPPREQQKEEFLREFPRLKRKLEDHIRKLRDLADHIDQVHKDCTISHTVSSSVGAASGILGILGLALAPLTGGASLALSATSLGLGAAASVTGITTGIVEDSMTQSDISEAGNLVEATIKVLEEILKIVPKIRVKLSNSVRELIDAFKRYQAIKKLASHGKGFLRGLHLLTKGARIRAGVFTSIFLAWDVYDLVNESMDLYNGAKTESAKALRDLAHKLREKVQVFEEIYKDLQEELPQ